MWGSKSTEKKIKTSKRKVQRAANIILIHKPKSSSRSSLHQQRGRSLVNLEKNDVMCEGKKKRQGKDIGNLVEEEGGKKNLELNYNGGSKEV